MSPSSLRTEPRRAKPFLLGALVAALLTTMNSGLAAPPGGPPRAQPSKPLLIEPDTIPRPDRVRPSAAVVRQRVVTVDLSQIAAIRSKDQRITFPLFAGTTVDAVFEKVVDRAGDRATWSGSLAGPAGGSFTLVVNENRVGARFACADGTTYVLRYLGDGLHLVEEIDQAQLPPCATEPPGAPLLDGLDPGPPAVVGPCDDGRLIDVLVVYTQAARDQAGGTEAILAEIELAVATTNASYANSLIDVHLRLAHAAEVDYDETWTSALHEHRNRLQIPGDGYLDEVHALRDLHGADAVSLLVASGQGCGIANIMNMLDPSEEQYAFDVVRRGCAVGNLTFAHELGHLLSCLHDRQHTSTPGYIFDYSHGFIAPSGLFRTVMALSCEGPDPCPRVQHFSNPNVTYLGEPTGVPAGAPDSADCASTINQTALIMANYRCADCNGNGVSDTEDIDTGTSFDGNANGIPDECETQRLFVDATATGGGDGTDWNSAFTDLQDALDAAAAVHMTTEIWVAAGTYRPDRGTGDRHASFDVAANVELFGGFAGGEVLLGGRDPSANPTILSGDLDGNDAPGFENIDDNCFRVVDAAAGARLLDGFTITGASTEGISGPPPVGGGLTLSGDTTVRNCVITSNSANTGAGVAILAGSAELIGCQITGNRAAGPSARGAGLFHAVTGGEPSLTNCALTDNAAEENGGAIFTESGHLELVNCSIGNNSAGQVGGGVSMSDGDLFAANCVLWGNTDADGSIESSQLHVASGTVDISSSCVQGWTGVFGGNANLGGDPMLADVSMRLGSSSPCIDAGNNALVPPEAIVDLDGLPRFADDPAVADTGNGSGPIVDIGAYEHRRRRLFVDAHAPAGGLGMAWDSALNDLQDALDVANSGTAPVEEIWVADGTYRPDRATGDRAASFHLPSGAALYGGFARGESDPDERVGASPTVLSGDLNGDDEPGFVNISDNSFHVVTVTGASATTVLDGFTISGGNCQDAGPGEDRGGGLHVEDGSPVVRNCIFVDNSATDAGALYLDGSAARVVDCAFFGNYADRIGGAVQTAGLSAGPPAVVNCVFSGNRARTGWGGAVNTLIGTELINCTVVGNSSGSGGGIAANVTMPGQQLACRNSVIWGNLAQQGAPDEIVQIHVLGGAIDISHSCVQGGTGSLGGAGNIEVDPRLLDPDGADDMLGTIDDDLTVMGGSPVIDAGDSDAVPSDVTTDLAGLQRFVDDVASPDTGHAGGASAVVDMGAYEFQGVPCPGDLDRDGAVGFADLTMLLAAWGPCEEPCIADIDGDDRVGFADLTELLAAWGACPSDG